MIYFVDQDFIKWPEELYKLNILNVFNYKLRDFFLK